MNWDAIGAIAETLGAVGVIASLVYLAGQIRHSREQMKQNTRAMQAGTYQEFQKAATESFRWPIENPDNRRVIRMGMEDYEQLAGDDAFLFYFWVSEILHNFENALYQHRVGLLEEGRWQAQRLSLLATLRYVGVTQWWNSDVYENRDFGPEFVALVEEILAEEPDRGE
jgi:hypothetical protein